MAWGKHDRSRALQNARRRTWANWKEEDKPMSKVTEDDKSFVLQTLGEASMGMWEEPPVVTFDAAKASEFADRIIERMEQIAQR